MSEVYYRYDYRLYSAGVDEFDNPLGPPQGILKLNSYRVTKTTRCGVWLDTGKFINNSWRKRWACPTVEEAAESYRARKRREIGILQTKISYIEDSLRQLDLRSK